MRVCMIQGLYVPYCLLSVAQGQCRCAPNAFFIPSQPFHLFPLTSVDIWRCYSEVLVFKCFSPPLRKTPYPLGIHLQHPLSPSDFALNPSSASYGSVNLVSDRSVPQVWLLSLPQTQSLWSQIATAAHGHVQFPSSALPLPSPLSLLSTSLINRSLQANSLFSSLSIALNSLLCFPIATAYLSHPLSIASS